MTRTPGCLRKLRMRLDGVSRASDGFANRGLRFRAGLAPLRPAFELELVAQGVSKPWGFKSALSKFKIIYWRILERRSNLLGMPCITNTGAYKSPGLDDALGYNINFRKTGGTHVTRINANRTG